MLKKILLAVTAVLMLTALYLIFFNAPVVAGPDGQPDYTFFIFYFHVPVDWVAFLAFFILFIGSVMYLIKRDIKWDIVAVSAAQIGFIFTTLMLVTGSIWGKARSDWWWTWDARLTTALVLWLILVAYLIVRSYIKEDERRARFSAVIGIVGFLDVPIVALSIVFLPTITSGHPPALIFEGNLPGQAYPAFFVSLAAFTLLFFTLFAWRVSLSQMQRELKLLKDTIGR
ncbi:MAG: cytochrome c biogenesis protein CcsA [Dehalococcoidales bacterium]|nr:cytochrome c biogenesis protein CcsA [Dehalococcoidales bacterium]